MGRQTIARYIECLRSGEEESLHVSSDLVLGTASAATAYHMLVALHVHTAHNIHIITTLPAPKIQPFNSPWVESMPSVPQALIGDINPSHQNSSKTDAHHIHHHRQHWHGGILWPFDEKYRSEANIDVSAALQIHWTPYM